MLCEMFKTTEFGKTVITTAEKERKNNEWILELNNGRIKRKECLRHSIEIQKEKRKNEWLLQLNNQRIKKEC